MTLNQATPAPTALVICLCAQWCDVCCDYRSRFTQVEASVRADYPQARFLWIDIEDDADLLHPLEVENFPTLLIAAGDAPRFFGPITPQVQTLERMVRMALQDNSAAALTDPALIELLARVQAEKMGAKNSNA